MTPQKRPICGIELVMALKKARFGLSGATDFVGERVFG